MHGRWSPRFIESSRNSKLSVTVFASGIFLLLLYFAPRGGLYSRSAGRTPEGKPAGVLVPEVVVLRDLLERDDLLLMKSSLMREFEEWKTRWSSGNWTYTAPMQAVMSDVGETLEGNFIQNRVVRFFHDLATPQVSEGRQLLTTLATKIYEQAAQHGRGWGITLDPLAAQSEPWQYVVYREGAYYKEHVDTVFFTSSHVGVTSQRQRLISVIVQLNTKGEDYAGEGLQIVLHNKTVEDAPGAPASAVMFPSFQTVHRVGTIAPAPVTGNAERENLVWWIWGNRVDPTAPISINPNDAALPYGGYGE